jgi:hypothetical protein
MKIWYERFVYYDGQLPQNSFGDPQTAIQYYNYMRGFWRDGTQICLWCFWKYF